jgi:PIN domain nuclease of toxin-antitoxin system
LKLLIDTHVLLWALCLPDKLKEQTIEIIQNENNIIYVSIATLWELQIKESINKIKLPDDFFDVLTEAGYEILPITVQHLKELKVLPNHHRDPFDRILIAQAKTEQLKLITQDQEIFKYEVQVITA